MGGLANWTALPAAGVIALTFGCGRPPAGTQSPEETRPAAASGSEEARARADEAGDGFSFPETSRPWTADDYLRAREALVRIAQTSPEALPRVDGPRRDVFEKLASLDEVTAAAASLEGDAMAMLDLGDAMSVVYKLYAARVPADSAYGVECVRLSAAYMRVAIMQTKTVVRSTGLSNEGLRSDRVRLEGLAKMRFGLVLVLSGTLELPLQAGAGVTSAQLLDAVSPVLPEVSTMLLPEERDTVAEVIHLHVSAAGKGRPSSKAALRAVESPPPPLPLVSDFVDEHRSFKSEQSDVLAAAGEGMVSPVELGPEAGGIRYAFPDRTISAVFDAPPNAMEQAADHANWRLASKVLGHRDATGFGRTVTCLVIDDDHATPPEQLAKQVLDGLGAKGIKKVKVGAGDAWEGTVAKERVEALVRVAPSANANCIIAAEYPPSIAASARPRARAFVDSVRLDGPIGVPSSVPR